MTTNNPDTIPALVEACPHCGGSDAFTERADFSSSYVVCNDCGAHGPTMCQESDDEDEPGQAAAIKRWNIRAAMPDASRVAELEELLRRSLRGLRTDGDSDLAQEIDATLGHPHG